MPNLQDFENKQETIDKAISIVSKELKAFRKAPLKNSPVQLIVIILFFLNSLVVQRVLDVLSSFGLDSPIAIKNLNPWYTIIWFLLIAIIFVYAVYQRIKYLTDDNGYNISSISPIKGLFAFDFRDADIFKHLERMDEIQNFKNALLDSKFRIGVLLAVSGCGKTSLLRAGLAPAIKEENGLDCAVVTLSNVHPLDSIFDAITEQTQDKQITKSDSLLEMLNQITVIKGHGKFFLILDQFEQFFTHTITIEERKEFISQLNEVHNKIKEVKILLSIRTDFSGYLYEIQKKLSFSLQTSLNYLQLEKFEPKQVVRIIKYILNFENVPKEDFDEIFLLGLASKELADDDGMISAASIQILLWIMKGKRRSGNLRFTENSFKSLGGIEGILQEFIEDELNLPNFFNQENAGLNCLLALIDLNTNLRAGQISLKELELRLPQTFDSEQLPEVLKWLENIRLINKISVKNEMRYELAHERLIFPIRNIENKTDTNSRKASQLLEKRTREWLQNQQRRKYLLSFPEVRFIRKNRALLTWGDKQELKQVYLQESYNYYKIWIVSSTFVVAIFVFSFFITQTLFYKVEYREVNDIKAKLLSSQKTVNPSEIILDSLINWDKNFAYKYCSAINGDYVKRHFIISILAKDQSNHTISRLLSFNKNIKDSLTQAVNLLDIADKLPKSRSEKCDSLYNIAIAYYLAQPDSIIDKDKDNDIIYYKHNLVTIFLKRVIIKREEQPLKLLLKYLRGLNCNRRFSPLMNIAKSYAKINKDSSLKYFNEALLCFNVKSAEIKQLKDILYLGTFLAPIDAQKSLYYFDEAFNLVESTPLRHQSIDEKNQNLSNIIDSMTVGGVPQLIPKAIYKISKISSLDYRNDVVQTICENLEQIPFIISKSYYDEIKKVSLSMPDPISKLGPLLSLWDCVRIRDSIYANDIMHLINALAVRIQNPSDKKDVFNAIENMVDDSNKYLKTDKRDLRILIRDFNSRLSDFSFPEIKYWGERTRNLNQSLKNAFVSSIITDVYKTKDEKSNDRRISSLISLSSILKMEEIVVDSLLKYESKKHNNKMVLQILWSVKNLYPNLVIKYSRSVDGLYKDVMARGEQQFFDQRKSQMAGKLMDVYCCLGQFGKAYRVLKNAEVGVIDINSYLTEDENSLLLYKINLVNEYRKRKQPWSHLLW